MHSYHVSVLPMTLPLRGKSRTFLLHLCDTVLQIMLLNLADLYASDDNVKRCRKPRNK